METPIKDLTQGATFAGRFEVIKELGRGGMGRVYKVFDKRIKEDVALKLLKPEISSDEKIIERFSNELKFARKIVHKNVSRMYDIGEENGKFFITMEYVSGVDLKSLIRKEGQLSIKNAVNIAKQICEGLSEAHRLGVIHRDLKPSNIMIDKEGDAHIMDFGIARSLMSKGITREGVMIGTPEYISPEQVEGKKADQRSDIYSLGIIIYEMLAGRVPFEGDTALSIALKHKTEIPKDPREFNVQIPESLSRIIMKCLEKKKEARFQSPNELLDKLKRLKIERDETTIKGKLSKIFFTPLGLTKKKAVDLRKKILKRGLRAAIYFLVIYIIFSAIGLVNDIIYGVKLQRIGIEHDIYYKNLFPIQKDWLPKDWEIRDCNACNEYTRLISPAYYDMGWVEAVDFGLFRHEWRIRNVFNKWEYNIQELKEFIDSYERYYDFDKLFDAVKCSKLSSDQMIQNDLSFYKEYILGYIRLVILKARIDCLEGNYMEGLKKLQNALLFTLDLSLLSHTLYEDLISIECFELIFRDLILLILSEETDVNNEIIKHLEKILPLSIQKIDQETSLYKDYLWLGKNYDLFGYMMFYRNKFEYYWGGKFFCWKHGFSKHRYLYKEDIGFYQGLFEGIKYIRNYRDKSIYAMDYFDKNTPSEDFSFIRYSAFTAYLRINIARMFGKLALIVLKGKKYGLDSPEFSSLKGSEFFINELSGRVFEITEEKGETFVAVAKEYKLSLKTIDYVRDHKQLLQSFKHFDFKSDEQVRSLFYSFELD